MCTSTNMRHVLSKKSVFKYGWMAATALHCSVDFYLFSLYNLALCSFYGHPRVSFLSFGPHGHMPHTLRRASALLSPRRCKILAPGTPGPHTKDVNLLSWAQHFAGASSSSTLKLNSYRRQLFMAPG